ncbi:hypothetical protein HCUR_01496 [Holospora curviuscula]|uniref:Uncharacterized protein n=1 Tax=Holospora curviuscula TaxID=1082868 RepID=A0A2S5R7G6_9PROT|nr:hypothetical protein HCUR_01496 [Holospora curviuscula]
MLIEKPLFTTAGPFDAFIHDLDTLGYFCGKLEASDGKPALINMILTGQEILEPNEFSSQASGNSGAE